MTVPGFVLAGGRSSRMGSDKAFLHLDGRPLAVRAAAVLTEGGCAPVSLVGRQPALGELGLPWISGEAGPHHPLVGIAQGLESAEPGVDRCLFAPCDLAHLQPEDIGALLAVQGPCVALVLGRPLPLLAVLPTASAPRARAFAAAGRSARDFVIGLPTVPLPDRLRVNLNSPDALARVAGGPRR